MRGRGRPVSVPLQLGAVTGSRDFLQSHGFGTDYQAGSRGQEPNQSSDRSNNSNNKVSNETSLINRGSNEDLIKIHQQLLKEGIELQEIFIDEKYKEKARKILHKSDYSQRVWGAAIGVSSYDISNFKLKKACDESFIAKGVIAIHKNIWMQRIVENLRSFQAIQKNQKQREGARRASIKAKRIHLAKSAHTQEGNQ